MGLQVGGSVPVSVMGRGNRVEFCEKMSVVYTEWVQSGHLALRHVGDRVERAWEVLRASAVTQRPSHFLLCLLNAEGAPLWPSPVLTQRARGAFWLGLIVRDFKFTSQLS